MPTYRTAYALIASDQRQRGSTQKSAPLFRRPFGLGRTHARPPRFGSRVLQPLQDWDDRRAGHGHGRGVDDLRPTTTGRERRPNGFVMGFR